MGIIQRLRDRKPKSQQVAVQEVSGLRYHSPLCSSAENVFAQLRPLVDELKMVQPYGVGKQGARLPLARTPELAALTDPNEEMGWAEFADLAFSTWLTEKELNIHVWKNQRGKIYGYTVLPVGSRHVVGGRTYFTTTLETGEMVELSRDEVMTLRFSRNPRNIDEGISPGIASLVWSQIDDVLAQYQLGHFENGAVPAYITIIRASTKEKYLEKRKEMEQGFHGAKNKGKTLFLWRQFLDDGSERDEVEVKTIQGSNASLAIKDIMSIVNDKLNKAFGVSNFILGDDSSAKYDNAELSQQQFLSHRVYPALFCFWDQFQHELDRITGGLGYSIEFELEIPELTDRAKAKAETEKIRAEKNKVNAEIKKTEVETENAVATMELQKKKSRVETSNLIIDGITTLIDYGATPDSVLTAMALGEEWRAAAQNIYDAKHGSNAEPVVTTSQETQDVHTHHGQVCGCGHTHDDLPQFSPDEIIERGIYDELVALAEALVDDGLGEQLGLSDEETQALVSRIVDKLTDVAEKGVEESQRQTLNSVQSLAWKKPVGYVAGKPVKDKEELVEAMEEERKSTDRKTAEDLVKDKLETRVEEIVKNYSDEVQDIIRDILNTSGEAKSASQIKQDLMAHLPKARAEMIARNETVHAFRLAKLEEARAQAKKYGLKMRKVWQAHPGGCPICEQMNGTAVDINAPFPAEQVDADGHVYAYEHNIYNENGDSPNAHVNCRCSFFVEVIDG